MRASASAATQAVLALAVSGLVGLGACREEAASPDASIGPPDGGASDLGAPIGETVSGAFTIVGCATLDQASGEPRCVGTAPLVLTFVPLVSGADTFVWTFEGGDPAGSTEIAPQVRYAQPGSYAVTLAAGGRGGTDSARGVIDVRAGAVGAPCAVPSDCDEAAGLTCLCGGGTCPGGLAAGLCTRPCGGGVACAAGELCVDLARGLGGQSLAPDAGVSSDAGAAGYGDGDGGSGDPDGGAFSDPDGGSFGDGGSSADGGFVDDHWRRSLCLPACTAASDCRLGLTCREVPVLQPGASSGGAYSFRAACFADALGDVGDACAAPDGDPDPARCLSGRCDPLGVRGLCTADCSTVACPSNAACATFNGPLTDPPAATPVCLRRCDSATVCSGDPLLDCEPAGRPGALGFTVGGGEPADGTYCAPRRCTSAADCAPAGTCVAMGAGSFCAR